MRKIISALWLLPLWACLSLIYITDYDTKFFDTNFPTVNIPRLQAQVVDKPRLTIPENIVAYSSSPVTVPVSFAGNGHQIAAIGFSIDYDETCLSMNGTENIKFNVPRGLRTSPFVDTADLDGEVDVIIADYSPPFTALIDDDIAFIEFMVTCDIEPGESTRSIPVRFSLEPRASFADVDINDIEGEIVDGSILLVAGASTPSATTTDAETVTPTTIPTAAPTDITSATMAPGTITPALTPPLTGSPLPSATNPAPPVQTAVTSGTPTPPSGPAATATATPVTPFQTPIKPPPSSSTANRPPIAVDDQITLNGDDVTYIDVLANDFDFDGDPLHVINIEQGVHGLVLLGDDGRLQYRLNPQPDTDPSTLSADIDIFYYTIFDRPFNSVADGMGRSDTATVIVALNAVNHLPKLNDDSAVTDEDTPLIIDVLANDTDIDGDILTVAEVSRGEHGTVTIQPDGRVLYTPDPDYYGLDDFIYYVDDDLGDPNSVQLAAWVEVEIRPLSDAPIAVPDAVILRTAVSDSTMIYPLQNDISKDGTELRILSITEPDYGTAILLDDNTILYSRSPGFMGTDRLTYNVEAFTENLSIVQSRSRHIEAEGVITVIVDPQEGLVQAVDDFVTTQEDKAITIPVLDNDQNLTTDAATDLSIFGVKTDDGTVVVNEDSSLTYTPSANVSGLYTVTYIVGNNEQGQTTGADVGTLFITVEPENDPPHAVIDSISTEEEKAISIDPLANDSDIDGDSLQITGITQASRGLVTLESSGEVRYEPAVDFYGEDTFTYKVADPQGAEDHGLVRVTVTNINDAPLANQDMIMTAQNQSVNIIVLNNDFDMDGDTLTVSAVTRAEHGGVLLNHNHMLTYVPNPDYAGSDLFQYTIDDGELSATTQVLVTVIEVDPALSQSPTLLFGEEPISIQLFLPFIQK